MFSRLAVAFCIVICALSVTQAQRCRVANQVTSDTPIDLTDFIVLLTVEIPETCGALNPLDLLPCRNELNVISGCCMPDCRDVFEQYTQECLQDLTEVLCGNEATAPAVSILNSMASRCDDDYAPLSCGDSIVDPSEEDDLDLDFAIGSIPEPEFDQYDLEDDDDDEADEVDDDDEDEDDEEEETGTRSRRGQRGL